MDKMDDQSVDSQAIVNRPMDQSSKNITVGWTSHHDRLVDGLWNSYQNNHGTDLDIQCGNRLITVHRLLLDLFLSADKLIEAASSIDQPDSSLELLLEFLYRGKVTFPGECLQKILDLAKKSNFQMFMDALEKTSNKSDRNSKSVSNRIYTFVAANLSKESPTAEPTNNCFVNLGRPTSISMECPSNSGQTRVKLESNISKKKKNTTSNKTADQELPQIKCQECSFKSRSKDVMLKHQARHKNMYKCTICPKRVADKQQLKRHLALHEASTLYSCKRCSYQTSHADKYQQHIACHRNKNQILCDPTLFVDSEMGISNDVGKNDNEYDPMLFVNAEIKIDTNDRILLCDICQQVFSDEYELFQHHELHKEKWLQCTTCPYRTLCNDHERFQVHVASHDLGVALIKCKFCPKKALDQQTLDQHVCKRIDQPDSEKLHLCPHCSYKTPNLNRHAAHVAAHLKKNGQEIKCQHCRNIYPDQSALDSHICKPEGRKLLTCTHCPYKTPVPSTLQIHIARRHNPNIALFKCNSCERPFLKENTYKKHLLICKLSGNKRVQCPHCNFTSKFRNQVGYHITAVHSAVKPYKCQIAGCDYATGHKTNLRFHIEARHTDPNRFVCETCGFSTGRRCHFRQHLLTHSEVPKYKCEECGKSYRHAPSLREHMASHTGIEERKHICHICGSAFRRRDHMRVHLRGVHKTDVEPVLWTKKKPKTT